MNQKKLDYWSSMVTRWHESKKSKADFCAELGLNRHTMSYWQGKLEKPKEDASPKFIKLDQLSLLEIEICGEITIRVPLESDPKWVFECIKNLR